MISTVILPLIVHAALTFGCALALVRSVWLVLARFSQIDVRVLLSFLLNIATFYLIVCLMNLTTIALGILFFGC